MTALLKTLYPKAKQYMKDHKRLSDILKKAFKKIGKLKDKETRKELMGDFYTSCELVRDWSNGAYRVIPKTSIMKIIVAIIYFVMPIDMIPDFILGTGLLDDATVISFLLASLKSDLDKYKSYKEKNEEKPTTENLELDSVVSKK